MGKQCSHAIRDMVARHFLGRDFFLGRTPQAGNGDSVGVLAHFGSLALGEIPRPGRKTRKRDFLPLGALLWGEHVTRLPGMVFRNFLVGKTFFLVGPPPAGDSDLVGVWPALARLQVPETQHGPNPTEAPLPIGGGPTEKQFVPETVAENHPPDSVVTFFSSIPGPLVLWGLRRAPRG